MPRIVAPLNDTQIKNAKPKDKDYTLTDGDGLALLVKVCGSKLWRFRYTFEGTRYMTSFGEYPITGLSDAREKRSVYQKDIANGINPNQAKKQGLQAKKAELKSQFHLVTYGWLDAIKSKNDESTHKKRIRAFERDIFPYFCTYDKQHNIVSSKPIGEVTHGEILNVIKQKEKTAVETAHRLLTDCNRLWLFAVSHGYTAANIIANISKKDALQTHEKKHYAKIVDEKILSELLRAIDGYWASQITKNALKLLCLLPLRAENIFTLRWDRVDLQKGLITIPRSEMKTKDKNLPDFVIPLSKQAKNVLLETKELTGWGVWVFHGHTNMQKHISLETCNKALRLMGFNDESNGRKQTTHSFRGTFRSLCDTYHDKHGAAFEVREAVLDHHHPDKTVRAYSHKADYTVQMRKLLQWWADFLDASKQ